MNYDLEKSEVLDESGDAVLTLTPAAIRIMLKFLVITNQITIGIKLALHDYEKKKKYYSKIINIKWLLTEKKVTTRIPKRQVRAQFFEEVEDIIVLLSRMAEFEIENEFKEWIFTYIQIILEIKGNICWSTLIAEALHSHIINLEVKIEMGDTSELEFYMMTYLIYNFLGDICFLGLLPRADFKNCQMHKIFPRLQLFNWSGNVRLVDDAFFSTIIFLFKLEWGQHRIF